EILVVINLSSRPFTGSLHAPKGEAFIDVTPDVAPPLPPDAPAPDSETGKRSVDLPRITLDAWVYRIFRRRPSLNRESTLNLILNHPTQLPGTAGVLARK